MIDTRMWTPRCFVLTFVLASACSSEPEPTEDLYAVLARSASNMRELPYKREVAVREITAEEYQAEREPLSPESVARLHDTWGRFGFFAPEVDLVGADNDASDWVAAYYEPGSDEITVIGDPQTETIVHEYVHALQDQHFDLLALDDLAETSDAFLTGRAVAEGDATLTEGRYYLRSRESIDLDGVDWGRTLIAFRDAVDQMLADESGPLYFVAYPSFTYVYGQEYALAKLVGATFDSPKPKTQPPFDWADNNRALTVPPASTLALYSRDDALVPPPVGLRQVPAAFTDRLTTVGYDRVGLWLAYLLFYHVESPAFVLAQVEGWQSDTALFVQDNTTREHGFVWATRWRNENFAIGFEKLWWQLHGGTDDGSGHGIAAHGGDPLYVERRATDVIVTRNIDPLLVGELAQDAFDGDQRRTIRPEVERRSDALQADWWRLLEQHRAKVRHKHRLH